jgi:hypothetical protein
MRADGVMFMRVWSSGRYKSWTCWWRVNELPVGTDEEADVPNVRLANGEIAEAPGYRNSTWIVSVVSSSRSAMDAAND